MAAPRKKLLYTVEEYLAFERAADERHEYIDGEIRAMAGESDPHNAICVNLSGELRNHLKSASCEVRTQNIKVRSGPEPTSKRSLKNFFSHPDIAVFCGEPRFHDRHRDVRLNPKVIFEVLSSSTEAFDRGEKFIRYRTHNDTLTDYILVSQKEPFIEHFARQPDGKWLLSAVSGLEATLYLASINCELKLAEIYWGVQFPPPAVEVSEPDQLPQE